MKTGDILELEVGSDLAYLQLTHNHFASGEGFWYGWFCRVFSRRFSKRPTSRQLTSLTAGGEQFGCFLSDVSQLANAGNLPIPIQSQAFPICKQPTGAMPSKSCAWILWNGAEERVAYRLPRPAAALPNREIVDSAVVKQRLHDRWLPSMDVPTDCIDQITAGFDFKTYPLLSEYEDNRDQHRDIWKFLETKGLIAFELTGEPLQLSGTGPFDNSAARQWLQSLDATSGWNDVLSGLKRFQDSPQRTATDSAIAVAAAGVILIAAQKPTSAEPQLRDFLKLHGPAPLDVLRLATVSLSAVLQRSGLREQWEHDERMQLWLQETSRLQLQLLALLAKMT